MTANQRISISANNSVNLSIINNTISINGKPWRPGDGADVAGIVAIHLYGEPVEVTSDASVTVNGSVRGKVNAAGSVTCLDVGGSVAAGGSVNAKTIHGNCTAGGSINHGR